MQQDVIGIISERCDYWRKHFLFFNFPYLSSLFYNFQVTFTIRNKDQVSTVRGHSLISLFSIQKPSVLTFFFQHQESCESCMEISANTPALEGLSCFPVYFSLCGMSSCIWKILPFRLTQKLLKDANFMGRLSLSISQAEFSKTVNSSPKEEPRF